MTPTDLLTTAHTETGTESEPVTKAECWLAFYAAYLRKGCSAAFLQAEFRVNVETNAELPKLNLDKEGAL